MLGSEIARLQNDELRAFDSLKLISQGGYPEPPSVREGQYLDDHFPIAINENHELIKLHSKFKAGLRVMSGFKHAYEFARRNGSDYALVTNADAWCLDIGRLKSLLKRETVKSCAISSRVGLVTAFNSSWGSHAPFFDDHFLILNIGLCEKYKVFDYDDLKAYNPHFAVFGGVHYMLMSFLDERVPPGLFNAYTWLEDCVNHYGEQCGFSLLPWQYQSEYSFLHANCAQEPELHPLRAEMLRIRGLDRFPEISSYCQNFPSDPKMFDYTDQYVYFRKTFVDKLRIGLLRWPPEIYRRIMRHLVYGRYAQVKHMIEPSIANSFDYYDLYKNVLPLNLATRRHKINNKR